MLVYIIKKYQHKKYIKEHNTKAETKWQTEKKTKVIKRVTCHTGNFYEMHFYLEVNGQNSKNNRQLLGKYLK